MMKALIPTLALLILNLADGAPTQRSNGAVAYFEWIEKGCDNWISKLPTTSTINLVAASDVETSNNPSISFYYSHWECTRKSATHTFVIADEDTETSTSVAISKNLKSGSVSSIFQAPIQIVKYRLNGEGEVVSPEEAGEVTLQATFVGYGKIYNEAESLSRKANVSPITLTAIGYDMPIPSGSQNLGYLYRDAK